MDPKELFERQCVIQQRIYEIAKTEGLTNKDKNAIPDGVADCEDYIKTKPRVAWILKEPYDYVENGDPKGGGWLLYTGFLSDNKDWEKNFTWQRIIYTMYGLRHGIKYDDMDYIRNNPDMGDVMKGTVILNLSKMPAYTTSSSHTFVADYNKYWKPILKEQIELYNPQIIIFDYTFSYCKDLFTSEDATPIKQISNAGRCFINLYKTDGRLLLDAYHPAVRSNGEFYVNSIIDTINNYFNK